MRNSPVPWMHLCLYLLLQLCTSKHSVHLLHACQIVAPYLVLAQQTKAQRWRWNVKRMKENNNDGNRENNEEILNKRTLPKRYHFQLETTETLTYQRKTIMCVSITIDCNGMFHDESRGHTMLTRQIYVFVRNTNTDHNRTSFSLFDSSSF